MRWESRLWPLQTLIIVIIQAVRASFGAAEPSEGPQANLHPSGEGRVTFGRSGRQAGAFHWINNIASEANITPWVSREF